MMWFAQVHSAAGDVVLVPRLRCSVPDNYNCDKFEVSFI